MSLKTPAASGVQQPQQASFQSRSKAFQMIVSKIHQTNSGNTAVPPTSTAEEFGNVNNHYQITANESTVGDYPYYLNGAAKDFDTSTSSSQINRSTQDDSSHVNLSSHQFGVQGPAAGVQRGSAAKEIQRRALISRNQLKSD